MESPSQEPNGAEHIVKRKVARAALKKASDIVARWRQDESDDRFATQFLMIVFITAAVLLFLLSMLWGMHVKIKVFVMAIVVGVFVGLVWIINQK